MLEITPSVSIPDAEIEMNAIRAQGAGGQNVNKVSSAIHLRFDIMASSLPEDFKMLLFNLRDKRITREGCILIKAQQYRTQAQNKTDAFNRLQQLIQAAIIVPKKRKPTCKTHNSVKRRLAAKKKRGLLKSLRKNTIAL